MLRFRHGALRTMALTLLFIATGATAALAGPPWISIEIPPNEIDPTTRGALALVLTWHHETLAAFPVEGVAYGIVDGRRVTREIRLSKTSRDGVMAVRADLPEEGTWIIRVDMTDGVTGGRASALLALGPGNTSVSYVKVPRGHEGRYPRLATDSDVDAMLATAALVAQAEIDAASHLRVLSAFDSSFLWAILLLPAALAMAMRRRQAEV